MKIQHLAVIFLVIAIPLIVVVSYYLVLQRETLELQTEYNAKLSEATKEAVKAFEVNTVDWNDKKNDTADRNRNTVKATLSSFTTSLANQLNKSGTAREFMDENLPAIAVTMYDGYYIYYPANVPETQEDQDGFQLFKDVVEEMNRRWECSNNIIIIDR